MHLKQGSGVTRVELTRSHVPTGRITGKIAIENAAPYLIQEFGVKLKSEERLETINRNPETFERYRTWA